MEEVKVGLEEEKKKLIFEKVEEEEEEKIERAGGGEESSLQASGSGSTALFYNHLSQVERGQRFQKRK